MESCKQQLHNRPAQMRTLLPAYNFRCAYTLPSSWSPAFTMDISTAGGCVHPLSGLLHRSTEDGITDSAVRFWGVTQQSRGDYGGTQGASFGKVYVPVSMPLLPGVIFLFCSSKAKKPRIEKLCKFLDHCFSLPRACFTARQPFCCLPSK